MCSFFMLSFEPTTAYSYSYNSNCLNYNTDISFFGTYIIKTEDTSGSYDILMVQPWQP